MLSEQQTTKYQEFFRKALEKFGVDSPADFKGDEEKKKFFDYVDKNFKGKNEQDEEVEIEEFEIVEDDFSEEDMIEANAFIAARSKAKSEGMDKFEFNGKTYDIVETDSELAKKE